MARRDVADMAGRHPKFITVEGGDGVGKTTQLHLLCEFLQQQGVAYTFVREPGGTETGEKVRDILLHSSGNLEIMTEALLYAASRAEVVRQVIRPSLAAGQIVVCDRFVDSSVVYQGIAGGLGVETVQAINLHATAGLEPGLTLLLDLPADVASERRGHREADRMEGKGEAFLECVQQGYRELAQGAPDRIRLIAADRPVAAVQADMQSLVADWLGLMQNGEGTVS